MSKTAQRKRSLYDQGFQHGHTGHYFVWHKHPHLGEYRRGYRDGVKSKRKISNRTFWQTLAFIFGLRGAK